MGCGGVAALSPTLGPSHLIGDGPYQGELLISGLPGPFCEQVPCCELFTDLLTQLAPPASGCDLLHGVLTGRDGVSSGEVLDGSTPGKHL